MVLRLLSFLPILLAFSFQALAQTFEPGLLVRSNGDTLRGEIENGFWDEPPTVIRFQLTAAGPVTVFKPRQLRAVSFTNGRYFRYEALPIDHAAETRLDRLARGYRPLIQVDSLLAEVLVAGPVTLLRVVLVGSPHYLLQASQRPILDLSERKYFTQSANENWAVTNANNYRGQLGIYFKDCAAAIGVAQTAAFTAEGIAAVVQAYNAQCGPTQQAGRSWLMPASPRRQFALQGGLLAGGRYSNVEFDTYNKCDDCTVQPYAGLYSDLFLPGRAYAIYGELSASPYNGKGSQTFFVPATGMSVANSYTYRAVFASVRLGIRRFIALPQRQQLLLGLQYEFSRLVLPKFRTLSGPTTTLGASDFDYILPAALPSFGVGWRRQRLTLGLDAQVYPGTNGTWVSGVISTNFALRLGVSYGLGRSSDTAALSRPQP